MGLIRIIKKNDRGVMENVTLPSFYMNDFSVMGLVVDQFEKTIETLMKLKCTLKQDDGTTWVLFDGIGDIQKIFSGLKQEKVGFSVSDIVSCAYQG